MEVCQSTTIQPEVRRGEGTARSSGGCIPKDSKRRLELTGFHVHAPAMAPLHITVPRLQPTTATSYRGNCRRSKARSRTCSGDSMLSDLSAWTASPAPSQRSQPIAGDVFAMHPGLLTSPTTPDPHTADASSSPFAYWKHKCTASPARSPVPPLTNTKASSPCIIFIDCPPQ